MQATGQVQEQGAGRGSSSRMVILERARAIMQDPRRVVLHPRRDGYETADGERLLLGDGEAGPAGLRCSLATVVRQAAAELGTERFAPVVNELFARLHLEGEGRGFRHLDEALAQGGATEALSIIDALMAEVRDAA